MGRRSGPFGGETLDLTNRHGLIHVGSQTDWFAGVVACAAQDRREGIVLRNDRRSAINIARRHAAHVGRHLLVDAAGVGTRRLNAVKEPEGALGLGSFPLVGTANELRIVSQTVGIGLEVVSGRLCCAA